MVSVLLYMVPSLVFLFVLFATIALFIETRMQHPQSHPASRGAIRTLYLYSAALVGLVIVTIAGYQLLNLGLKTWVFPAAGDYEYGRSRSPEEAKKRRQNVAAEALALLLVGAPLFALHWRAAQKERANGNGSPPATTP